MGWRRLVPVGIKRRGSGNSADIRMNYAIILSIPLYLSAAIHSLVSGRPAFAGVWFCYAAANAFMVYAESVK